MKKILTILTLALVLCSIIPMVSATSVGVGVGLNLSAEKFKPLIWMCGDRNVTDNEGQPGRITGENNIMIERIHNYAFEGEKIHWTVLVMDKNKIEEVQDVVGTLGTSQGTGNDVEVECVKVTGITTILDSCNARILEEQLTTFDPAVMAYYECTFTVEPYASMNGKRFLTVEARSADGEAIMAENEYWFLNPIISLGVDGVINFNEVRPGTTAYSDTILISNNALEPSGVLLDMFISGTNFYDPSSSGARCPTTNELNLNRFRYFATNGAYSTQNDLQTDDGSYPTTVRNRDTEGYVNIHNTMESFNTKFFNEAEIIQDGGLAVPGNTYYLGNTLSPGSEMAITFKLNMPEPCVGDFSQGNIYFWGEAI